MTNRDADSHLDLKHLALFRRSGWPATAGSPPNRRYGSKSGERKNMEPARDIRLFVKMPRGLLDSFLSFFPFFLHPWSSDEINRTCAIQLVLRSSLSRIPLCHCVGIFYKASLVS